MGREGPGGDADERRSGSTGDVKIQAKVVSPEAGLLGGEGLVMQRLSGTGVAFIHAGMATVLMMGLVCDDNGAGDHDDRA